ncbi:hypothetical protein [Clostridium estertheticum]|uniref:Uncharacterized protein n=1 Tax=Clostridium estertheticum TaxID=238834 RepID=A0A7Y3SWW6_9CLOT|nr:hypothetical protein [Clostridium estertheticum]MBW9171275.1 hypothetical protein [Clostridium estertheticum]NNU76865.1 hypothetical protein [Clostridium estertheticum]WBL48736.1 hypothetical protein LOR37_08770 [Clostridium estertheticum]WLC76807.1 hypothetical protein KTC99_08440 [Clostridium estertheticum]
MVDLKGMSKHKKAEYIWEYYKFHIIGALAAICIIISIIHSQITKPDYVFNLTMISNIADTNKVTNLESLLTKVVVKDGSTRKKAIVSSMPIDTSKNANLQTTSQYMQKLTAEVSVGELDVIILDKTMFESFAKQDMFLRLDNISELNLDSLKGEKIHAIGSDKKNDVYAIDAKDITLLKKLGFDTKNKVIGIVGSTKQKYNSILVLKYLLSK